MTQRPLIIFDLDGTLYETGSVLVRAVEMAAADLGLPIPDGRKTLSGIGLKSKAFYDHILPDSDTVKRSRFSQLCSQYERELIGQFGRLYDGVREMLAGLVDLGAQLAVCTNGSEEYAVSILAAFDLKSYFPIIRGSSKHSGKSELIAQILAETAADWAVMVGDRDGDRHAARSNDLPFILAEYGYSDVDDHNRGFSIAKPSELPSMVRQFAVFNRVCSDLTKMSTAKPVIVGVTGIDTSGKTEFAKALGDYLREKGRSVQLIHLDDFHNPAAIRNSGPDLQTAYIENAFDLKLLTKEVLEKARTGSAGPIVLTLLDLESDQRTRERSYCFNERSVVILEGVLLYRGMLDHYFDYRIFLHISFEESRRRAKARDVPRFGENILEKYERKYIPVQKWFLTNWHPMERSNLVVDNTDYRNPRLVAAGQLDPGD